MISVRKAEDRGFADHGWLKTKHTFSFASYQDEKHMGFGPLRVINEDRIEGGTGFDTHGHRDMEIISYVIEGALQHKDSMGNTTIIKPGEIQRMSAGTGIRHSEYNAQTDTVSHFLQIWIMPEKLGITPSYGQKIFSNEFACSDMVLVASKSGQNGSITLNQDVDLYVAQVQDAGEKTHKTYVHRRLWVQLIKGMVEVNGTRLSPGDGAGIEKVDALMLKWESGSEFLLFDMP